MAWFHVEHCPIEPSTSPVTSLFDQLMNTRLDDLNWERSRELGE
jgi:hypothetical protein